MIVCTKTIYTRNQQDGVGIYNHNEMGYFLGYSLGIYNRQYMKRIVLSQNRLCTVYHCIPLVCCHINFEDDDTWCDFGLPNFEIVSMSPPRFCFVLATGECLFRYFPVDLNYRLKGRS